MNSLVQTYQWVSVIGYICAGVFLAAAVFLFFYLNIPQVLGYLTKRTERKAVEAIRAENEQKMEKSAQEIAKTRNNAQTDEISTERLEQDAKISMIEATTLLDETGETTLLDETAATTVLAGAGAAALMSGTGETTLLGEAGETTVLEGTGYGMGAESRGFQSGRNMPDNAVPANVVVEEEILWIHTTERISDRL